MELLGLAPANFCPTRGPWKTQVFQSFVTESQTMMAYPPAAQQALILYISWHQAVVEQRTISDRSESNAAHH